MSILLDPTTEHTLALYELPSSVKTASREARTGDDSVPAHQFADTIRRVYPLHTGAAVLTSAALFDAEKRGGVCVGDAHRIEERIRRAAAYHGVLGQLDTMLLKRAALDNITTPDEWFGVVYNDNVGNTRRHYPLRNPEEIKLAAEYLSTHRGEFDYPTRRMFAERILNRADDEKVALEKRAQLESVAGRGLSTLEHMIEQLEVKAGCYRRQPAIASQLRNVVDALRSRDTLPPVEELNKLAQTIDDVDQTVFSSGHAHGPLVEDVFFSLTPSHIKQASTGWTKLANGAIFTDEALADSPAEIWEKLAGISTDAGLLAQERCKTAAALSPATATAVTEALQRAGVQPFRWDPVAFDRPDLEKLATEYAPR